MLFDVEALAGVNGTVLAQVVCPEELIQPHLMFFGNRVGGIPALDPVNLSARIIFSRNFKGLSDIQVDAVHIVQRLDFFGRGIVPLGERP